jgi:hypothetical protein
MNSTEKLVRALREAGASQRLLARARADEFNDYRSRHALPQHELLAAARAEGLEGICQSVINGEFDATVEESDMWAASPEGQEAFRELLGRGFQA